MADQLPLLTDIGETPVVFARNYEQHVIVCRVLGLNPSRTRSSINVRQLEGLRPTSLIFAPSYYEQLGYSEAHQTMDRSTRKMRTPVPRIYLTEEQLRG